MKNQDQYLETFTDLGLKPQEAKVYLACLKLGQSTVGKIADESGVQRTFVYDILKDLHIKGIVSSVEMRGKKHFSAVSVEQFKRIQEEKFNKFVNLMPELKAFETTVGDRPKVRFYEGKQGIFAAAYDTLEIPRGSEILAYSTGKGLWSDEPEFALKYIKDRVKKGIASRAIAPDLLETKAYTDNNEEHMRNCRLVPADKFGFTNEINIYGNKVLIMSLQGELLAVMIESESVAKTQRMIFELAWLGAQSISSASKK